MARFRGEVRCARRCGLPGGGAGRAPSAGGALTAGDDVDAQLRRCYFGGAVAPGLMAFGLFVWADAWTYSPLALNAFKCALGSSLFGVVVLIFYRRPMPERAVLWLAFSSLLGIVIADTLWLAALLNPIPPLGVAPELRPRVLLSPSPDERLAVVYAGLARSLAHLEDTRRGGGGGGSRASISW